jgi:hypothetical protein
LSTEITLTVTVEVAGNADAEESQADALMDRFVTHLKDLSMQDGGTIVYVGDVTGWPPSD